MTIHAVTRRLHICFCAEPARKAPDGKPGRVVAEGAVQLHEDGKAAAGDKDVGHLSTAPIRCLRSLLVKGCE